MSYKEQFLYDKPQKNCDAVPVWLCFPYAYMFGMSTLGYLSLFKFLDRNPDVLAQRVFIGSKEEDLEYDNPELISFSLLMESDYTSVFKILQKNNIPLMTKDRKDEPLVFAGGPVLSANPEPFADFFDFIIIGDGENIMDLVVETYKQVKHLPTREEKLRELAKIHGIYVPSLYKCDYNKDWTINSFKKIHNDIPDRVNRICTLNLKNCLSTPILSEKSFYPDTFYIEMGRGCTKKCKFCTASYHNLPARYPSLSSLKSVIDTGLESCSKLSFIGAMVADHPEFDKVCKYLLEKRLTKEFSVEFSSLKAEKISPIAIEVLKACNNKEVSIAIEAGSQRVRNNINKRLDESQIRQTIASMYSLGIEKVSIYLLIGLPDEHEEDIQELSRLVTAIKEENQDLKLNVIVSTFIPKSQTPYQWAAKESTAALNIKIEYLKNNFKTIGVEYGFSNTARDYINTVISRADRRLGTILKLAFEKKIDFEQWQQEINAINQQGIESIPDLEWYAIRQRPLEENLPWDFIDNGYDKSVLIFDLHQNIDHTLPLITEPACV